MPRFDIFAKRQGRPENLDRRSAYDHHNLPEQFRTQVVWILRDLIGFPNYRRLHLVADPFAVYFWETVRNTLAKELGQFFLASPDFRPGDDCVEFLLRDPDVAKVLSLIEICFRLAEEEHVVSQEYRSVNDAAQELNDRFREHGIGYQYQAGVIVIVESQLLHTETVEPAVALLRDARFSGPLEEFMEAHAHFRKGELKEAITDAGNAFESTMKAICDSRGWHYDPKRCNASRLLEILFQNQLIPSEMQAHFNALRTTLETGVPAVRNQAGRGAHGQGRTPVDVPGFMAAYCLNLTGTNIVFMVDAYNSMSG